MSAKLQGLVGWWLVLLFPISLAASGDLRLVDAVKSGNEAAVRSLLEQHADVNAAEADGATPLMWAVQQGQLEIAGFLIRAGANVNAVNDYGATALWLACERDAEPIVEKLLQAKADPNVALPSGETPLMTCSRTGDVHAVASLLAHGANVNAKEKSRGQTPLMWAVSERHSNVVRLLIDGGADLHARSATGFTPILFAARNGDMQLIQLLLDAGVNINEASTEDGSALVVASASTHQALALFLLDKGADPNAADGYGATPLHYAMQRGLANLSGVIYSSQNAAPSNRPNISTIDYIYLRVPPPNMPELAKALLKHGANPNARIVKDFRGRAPFPDLGPMTLIGATPFLLATAAADLGLMNLLLDSGADPRLGVKGDATPLMVAAGMGRVQDFMEGEEKNALEAVKLLAKLGADIKAANARSHTAVHAAAYAGADSIIQFLADNGADVDAKDPIGQTPFTIAMGIVQRANDQGSVRIHESTANLLLKLGATRRTKEDLKPYTIGQAYATAVRYVTRGER